jgi:signal peptidase I
MRPTYPPGALVVVKPTPFDDINIGDTVTYQLNSGEPEVATHRVIGRTFDAERRPVLLTQGDANPSPDAKPVVEKQVKGTVWYSVRHLGRVSSFLTSAQRQLVLSAVVIGLLGYAALMFISAARDRTSSRRRPDDRQEAR